MSDAEMGDPRKMADRKRAMRAELRQRRRNMTISERDTATEQLTRHLTALTQRLDVRDVAAYLPNPEEPNIRPWLSWALKQGIRVLLPISREDGLLDWVLGDGTSERHGELGVPEPVGDILEPTAVDTVDLIIVPAAAVARDGVRMGWGRGYYDRMLNTMKQRPPVYAVVFDTELLDAVPTELHDRPVDGVITPSGTIELHPTV